MIAIITAGSALVLVFCLLRMIMRRLRKTKRASTEFPSTGCEPTSEPDLVVRPHHRRNPRPEKALQGCELATSPGRGVPVAMLLRRLGWRHRVVVCRDGDGNRAALHLWRRTHEVVEIELPGGSLAKLTNLEAGQFRAALREVLLDEHRSHQNGAA